jgi:hypothetical protein
MYLAGLTKGDDRMSKAIARRCRIDLATPAELKIQEAMESVENAGCHPLLTDAVILLDQALNKVADFVELPTAPLTGKGE